MRFYGCTKEDTCPAESHPVYRRSRIEIPLSLALWGEFRGTNTKHSNMSSSPASAGVANSHFIASLMFLFVCAYPQISAATGVLSELDMGAWCKSSVSCLHVSCLEPCALELAWVAFDCNPPHADELAGEELGWAGATAASIYCRSTGAAWLYQSPSPRGTSAEIRNTSNKPSR
jgi:hypothetical protein